MFACSSSTLDATPRRWLGPRGAMVRYHSPAQRPEEAARQKRFPSSDHDQSVFVIHPRPQETRHDVRVKVESKGKPYPNSGAAVVSLSQWLEQVGVTP
jgi:hypothetical protein